MSHIKFKEISSLSDDFVKIKSFAESFVHVINLMMTGRVFDITRGNITIGYADVVYLPTLFPAFHPELTRPRDVVEAIEGWKRHCEIATGGEGFIGVPLEGTRKTFPREMLEHRGFTRMNREVYALRR